MPKTIYIKEKNIRTIVEGLNEFMVDKGDAFGSQDTYYFVLFKGKLMFFKDGDKKKIIKFLDDNGESLGIDVIENFNEKLAWVFNNNFGGFVDYIGATVPYLLTGTIYHDSKVYVNYNEFYDVLRSNELRQLVKSFPNYRFFYDGKDVTDEVSENGRASLDIKSFYHGTIVKNAVDIVKKGLRPMPSASSYKAKHEKTVFFANTFSEAKSYARHAARKSNDHSWASTPCVIEFDVSKVDKNKIVLDYGLYNAYMSDDDKNDAVYSDVLKKLGKDYDSRNSLVDNGKNPLKYNKVGYRGVVMPNAITAIYVLGGLWDDDAKVSKEELLQAWNENMRKNESASAEEDEYEIGSDGDCYYHINESYGNDMNLNNLNVVEFIPHENAAEEGWDDEDFEPYYDVDAYDTEGNRICSGNMTVEELLDMFPEAVVHGMTDRGKYNIARKVNNHRYRIDDIAYMDTTPTDENDVDEVNAIAKRIQCGDESQYLLTDGDFIGFHDHAMISSIDGMTPNKFEALGNIRLSHSGIELVKEPTTEQIYALKQYIGSMGHTVYVDIGEKSAYTYPTTVTSGVYSKDNPNRIVNDILHYFEDGIKLSSHVYESIKMNENAEDEVKPTEVNLSSFKKQDKLVPSLWKDGLLDSRVRLQLLDIADDFWEFVDIKWVKPKGIILTGSICNYNWSSYSDIDLHLIVDFDEIDEKTNFVRDYLDAKKNEWNDEHTELNIYGYNVELYVQNIDEMPQSSGIYDLEENEWIREPRKEDVKSIKLNKFGIKDKAAEIMTIIDGLAMALDNAKDSHEVEEVSDDAEYLWAKIKSMRTKGLEKDGESSSANIVYKYMRRQKYLDKLWKIRQMGYDKLMSIDESKSAVKKDGSLKYKVYIDGDYDERFSDRTWKNKPKIGKSVLYHDCVFKVKKVTDDSVYVIEEGKAATKGELIKEYLDKNYNAPLVKYFKWAEEASDDEKIDDLIHHCCHYLEKYAAEVEDRYPEFIDEIDYDTIMDYDEDEIMKFEELLKQNNLYKHFISTMGGIADAEELPTWFHTRYLGIVKNEWCIHFGSDAESIARDGFTDGVDDLDQLAYTGSGNRKGHEGYNFAYKITNRHVDDTQQRGVGQKYGTQAVIFRTSGVEIDHYADEEEQVIFWGPYAHDFVPIKLDEYSLDWAVEGKDGQTLYSDSRASNVALWVANNYDQYRKQMVVGKSGIMPKRWNNEKGKYTTYGHALENPYPFSESVKKYLHTLKEVTLNEEVVADGNAEHNPFAKKWKMERKALKDFLCNFGRIMTSKENGKQYKVYYDESMSKLIGYNYCICIQWDPITMKAGSVIYIRALDKFTNRTFQAQFDDRGRDNERGTYDDTQAQRY